ncbi:Nucleoside 5-triphosphatase RdgB (dHAPTP, dITP,XTP-specific) [Klebsiella pneumoniae ISC21]|nr:Nucleoside 5-triphosphatase RdgB (dHAPTP, dITP,XTP-specific) [Klebsiella pneumoniae ISC21]
MKNAILKARHAAQITGLPAIADDSGLAVDALGGAPGIYFRTLFRRRCQRPAES